MKTYIGKTVTDWNSKITSLHRESN
jgi:hypothetical protein